MRSKRTKCIRCNKRRVCDKNKLCNECMSLAKIVIEDNVKHGLISKQEANFMSRDHGRAPSGIETYEPILNFNPNDAPANYIIVKMNHNLLDEMLRRMTSRQGAIAIGVPCKRVR